MPFSTYTYKDSSGNTQTAKCWSTGTSLALPVFGWTTARIKSAASTNATNIKNASAVLGGLTLYNNNAAARHFKLYDKASAPTVGTDTPKFTFSLAPNSARSFEVPGGMDFSTGLSYAITTGIADTDTAAVAVDDVTGVLLYL